jgi:hypothetical protein
MTRTETRAKWAALVLEQASSGKNASAWCRGRQLNPKMFWRWKRRLAKSSVADDVCGFVEVVGVEIPERILAQSPRLALDFGHGLRLELPSGFDAVELRRTVSVLREAWR